MLSATVAFAQRLQISAVNERLDKILEQIDVELSFDSRALSVYTLTVDKSFPTPEKALDYLLADKPFTWEVIGGVYVISPQKQREHKKDPKPKPKDQSTFANRQQVIELPQISVAIGEVVVTAPRLKQTPTTGHHSAEITANHRTAKYMPGSGDNSVFNLLRMMPGVRASGEPSNELIVWGSSAGESRIIFDGITLFGMRSFNDNISFINPYLVNDIRLLKGGYGVSFGNQVGAIAQVRGLEPNITRPGIKATLSTLTANICVSLPVTKRSILTLAYRRTFYDLYQSELLNPYNGKRSAAGKGYGQGGPPRQAADVYITPNYSFSDLNVNYSGTAFEKDRYRIALYGADDRFDFTATPVKEQAIEATERSRQAGGAATYNRVWNERNETRFAFSASLLETRQQHLTLTASGQNSSTTEPLDNTVCEISAKITHTTSVGRFQKIEAGLEFENYTTHLSASQQTLSKPTAFLTDHVLFGRLSVNAGLRIDMAASKVNVQPRLSARYTLSDRFIATASWGLYNQYLARTPYAMGGNNFAVVWELNETLHAMHTIAGIAYKSPSGFSATLEGYSKQTDNTIRLIKNSIVRTNINTLGGDLFVKHEFRKAALFGSYSLTHISDRTIPETGQEIKLGSLVTLGRFILSANYVYGTGFSSLQLSGGQGYGQGGATYASTHKPYSRFDMAATYRHQFNHLKIQTGISFINVFNTDNIKYSYTVQSKKDPVTLYSGAMPFTPMLFFEVIW